MFTNPSNAPSAQPDSAVIEWLLDSDPAIRWQVMRDLIGAPAAEVAAERARVATHGWGAQLLATLRTSQNKNDYRLGNVYESSLWIAYRLLDWLSVSARLNGIERDNIEGADPDYDPQFIATADPERRGGRVVRALLGFNFLIPGETFGGLRLNLEYGEPIYQHLNGPQLEEDALFSAGVLYAF